jgi:thiosulfate/3-mercaptopyruvate sulfurtransferase
LPDPAALAARFASLGIGAQTQVVVYDDSQGMIAGRLWWLLRWLGHDRVAVLDGGLPAWQAAGGSLTGEITPPPVAEFVVRRRDTLVDADHVRAFLQTSRLHLVDARSPDRFRGENETLDPVGGHIPGAANRFFRDNLQADGRFKPVAELRAEWLAVLAGRAPELVVHQCGSGVSACHNILAMELAGLPGSRLYAGSWSEWCADPARPVAVGYAPDTRAAGRGGRGDGGAAAEEWAVAMERGFFAVPVGQGQ